MASIHNVLQKGVSISPRSEVHLSYLSHARVAPGCRIISCQIEGTPEAPIMIEEGVELIDCQLRASKSPASFSFGPHQVSAQPVVIGAGSRLEGVRLEGSSLGAGVVARRCHVLSSQVGDGCVLRPHGSLTLTYAAPHCNLGSELSKTLLLGEGFVSEHTASYLSLVAPADYPILTEDGREALLEGLPNLTNIGAGTVFANYSGKPRPAETLDASSGSQKGTAVVYGAFTAVNSVIVNRYGQPSAGESPFDLLQRDDLTILGLGCLVEKKVTGRIPAFSYAYDTSARKVEIGWVLKHQPGIILNIHKKMKKLLKDQSYRLQGLLEGTLRLELAWLEAQRMEKLPTRFSRAQLDAGMRTYQEHLDGRWALADDGSLRTTWCFDHAKQRWSPMM